MTNNHAVTYIQCSGDEGDGDGGGGGGWMNNIRYNKWFLCEIRDLHRPTSTNN